MWKGDKMKKEYNNIHKLDKIYKIKPIKHCYEEDECVYVKYSCPICEKMGIKHGRNKCIKCGINIDWSDN